jgi:hypothetical protein
MQTEDIIPMDQILEKQKELEAKAPHEVSAISYNLMDLTIKEMKSLLVFINSTGRKPWRPNPLSKAEILKNGCPLKRPFLNTGNLTRIVHQPSRFPGLILTNQG